MSEHFNSTSFEYTTLVMYEIEVVLCSYGACHKSMRFLVCLEMRKSQPLDLFRMYGLCPQLTQTSLGSAPVSIAGWLWALLPKLASLLPSSTSHVFQEITTLTGALHAFASGHTRSCSALFKHVSFLNANYI